MGDRMPCPLHELHGEMPSLLWRGHGSCSSKITLCTHFSGVVQRASSIPCVAFCVLSGMWCVGAEIISLSCVLVHNVCAPRRT